MFFSCSRSCTAALEPFKVLHGGVGRDKEEETLPALADTGADENLIDEQVARRMGLWSDSSAQLWSDEPIAVQMANGVGEISKGCPS